MNAYQRAAEIRRKVFKAWARRTFDHPAFPLVHVSHIYKLQTDELATIEWILTTPSKWARCRFAGQPDWTTTRVGPLVLMAIRFDA